MRIALVYDRLYPDTKGGVERRVWELATRLVKKGAEVHLLVPRFWAGNKSVTREGVVLRGVSSPRRMYSPKGRRAVLHALAHAFGVWRVLRSEPFDVIDCQIPAHLAVLAAATASPESRSALVVTWHEVWGRDWIEEMGLAGYVGRLIERSVAHLTAVHVAVSEHVAELLSDVGGRAASIVPPGVDINEFAGPGSDDPGPASDVLFVGRLIPTKNLGLLIKATKLLVRDGGSPRVLVVGEGPTERQWRDEVTRLDLDDNFRFVPGFDHWEGVVAALRATKVLALPSVREGFGMVALEAAGCGVPVVTVNHRRNAASRFVEEGITGLRVANEPMAFGAALASLLTDDALRQRLGSQAMRKAMGFPWDAVVDATQRAYASVLD